MEEIEDQLGFVKQACKNSLGAFCSFMNGEFTIPSHIQLLLDKLKEVEEGKTKRLIINMPPRFGKSLLISKLFPAWYLGRNPKKNVIFTTYGQDLADNMGRSVRNTFLDPKYKSIFDDVGLASDSSAIRNFATNRGGEYCAVGAGGALTGKGGDCIIIDDPHKNRQEANSELIRSNIIEWFNSTLYTRLAPNGILIIIQTRWHEEDLAGYLIKHQPHMWDVVSLPAINECNESLWPTKWPLKELLAIKKTIGSYEWSSLYQQSPMIQGGNIIKREWIKTYKELPYVHMYSWSWDTAIKDGQENDYSVGTLWAECDNGYYLVELFRQKIEYPELRKSVNMLYNKKKTSEVLIEDKASGQQLLQDFRRISNMPVIAMMPGKDMPSNKKERMNLIAPQFEAGKVYIPEDAPWAFDFISEITTFPNSKHDDICDSISQYLSRKLRNKVPSIRQL